MTSDIRLLYISGNSKIDKLVEEKYQGEDVYVNISAHYDELVLKIKEFSLPLKIEYISKIQLLYDDGLIAVNYFSDEYLFSYDYKLSTELLSLFMNLNVVKEVPEFINQRYLQLQDTALFGMIEKQREKIKQNEYIHFFDDIDELQYSEIIESFAPDALAETPLIYIKYIESDEKENGLLVTTNNIYCPGNCISVKDVYSINIQKVFDLVDNLKRIDTIALFINGQKFSNMKLFVWDATLLLYAYTKEFPLEEIIELIRMICEYLKAKSNQERNL